MVVKRVVSIEVGETFTRICDMDYKSKNPKVYKCVSFETPENIIEDGFIREKERFAEILRTQLEKEKIMTKAVVFSVSSPKITSREVTIPYVKEKYIADLVNSNKSEYFPMDIEDYTITYNVIEKKKMKEEKFIRLLVLAAPNHLIKNYYSIATLAGLSIEAIDYVGNSTFQMVKKVTASGVQMVVMVSESSSIIYVLEDSKLILQRTVPYGIADLVESVINSSCYSANNTIEALSLLEKEHILNGELNYEIDISETAATYIGSEEIYKRQLEELNAKEKATATMAAIINNIIRVEEYFIAKYKGKRINNIYITGIGAKVRGIHTLVNNEVTLDVKKVDHLIGVNFKSMEASYKDEDYIACIGAAINPCSFVPKDVIEEKDRARLQRCILFVIGSVIISTGMFTYSFVRYNSSKNTLSKLKEKEERLGQIEQICATHDSKAAQLNSLTAFLDGIYSNNVEYNTILKQLETSLPRNMQITSIDSSREGFSFQLNTNTKLEVAELLIQLRKYPQFSSCSMTSMTKTEQDNGISSWITTISCEYADALNMEKEE